MKTTIGGPAGTIVSAGSMVAMVVFPGVGAPAAVGAGESFDSDIFVVDGSREGVEAGEKREKREEKKFWMLLRGIGDRAGCSGQFWG